MMCHLPYEGDSPFSHIPECQGGNGAFEKRRLKLCWTCSDYAHHEHKWWWTARLCGKIQECFFKIMGIDIAA